MQWYVAVLKQYARFDGRAGRREFWWFTLWSTVIAVALTVAELALGLGSEYWGPLSTLYAVGVWLPALAVGTRRLHDTGRSGWWQLLILVPIVGCVILLVWWAGESEASANDWGPGPWDGLSPA